MRETSRRWLIRLAWAGLLVTGAMLVGIRVGRPVYYTDGARELAGRELAAAGMLLWQTPEVAFELPGPVEGRVAELPDGRLLYGRRTADGTTDLVVFDPQRPNVAPEPAYGLNTRDNELAPACGGDGAVYFASDRPADGAGGGYDLFRSTWTPRGFTRPVALELCNTAADETDPAPRPGGGAFVFVRIDPALRNGDNGTLYRCDLDSNLDPEPLFGAVAVRAALSRARTDRDPAFACDGGALWFVRKELAVPLRLMRVSLLGSELDEPVEVGDGWRLNRLRAPAPGADGATLGLLQSGRGAGEESTDLWFVSTAREVYPWWAGQRWLEWLLLGLFLTFLLLILLLHLGRRWTALDLLAQCLLLSLLLHLLLFLWLMGVEITGALLDGNQDGGSLEVTVLSASASDSAASGDGQRLASIAALVKFEPSERALDVAAPGAAVARAENATVALPERGFEAATAPATPTATDPAAAALADRAELTATRDGSDAELATAAQTLPPVAASERAGAAAAASERAAASGKEIVVSAPGGTVARAAAQREHLTDGSAGRSPTPLARQVAVAEPELAAELPDNASARRSATGAAELPAPPSATPTALAGPSPTAAVAATAAARAAGERAEPDDTAVAAPAGSLARGGSSGQLAPQGALTAPPAGSPTTKLLAGAVALQDERAVAAAELPDAPAAPAARFEPAATPLAAPTAPSDLVAARATPRAGRDALEIALPEPSSELARPAWRGDGPAASRPSMQLRGDAVATAGPQLALRDRDAAPKPRTNGHHRLIADEALARPEPAALTLAPRPSPIERPQRARQAGVLGMALPVVRPPGSLLQRAAARPLEVAAVAPETPPTTAYSNRFGPRKAEALERYGGTAATERAVADGLRYLARIQNRDGSWGDGERFDGKYGFVYVGKTALCVLAFLGAGHTPSSQTEHSAVVARALDHLIGLQDEDTGAFGASSCYGHGIATYALAECYGMTKDPKLVRPLEEGLTWILENQGPRRDIRNRGGWGYFSPGLQREDSYARVSVSSWMIMALESARMSGVELPEDVLPRAREFLQNSFDRRNGWFRYNHKPSRLQSGWPTLPASTPAGAFCLMLLGAGSDDRMVQAALDFTVDRRPREYRRYDDDQFVLQGQGNVYFWYYGTLCCFLAGGPAWDRWNERLSTLLPAAQSADGSFAPIDVYAVDAGDNRRDMSYTTAMCVLSLEVYYRYFTPLLLGR